MTSSIALTVLTGILLFIVIAVLPGALLFRAPILRREFRAALPFEERWFWQVVTSAVWSTSLAFALAAASAYSLPRLVGINMALVAVLALVFRGRLRLAGESKGPRWPALLPLALAVFGLWRFLPASEYLIGGKDPGVYVNEGISLHRTGTIFRYDTVVADIPANHKDLFFHDYERTDYYAVRFMGVFLHSTATGEVMAQFPHLLSASIALGYGMAGLYGATSTVVFWAITGLLAVYFYGARLAGRAPAFAATILLALNVIEAWYGKFPNAEVVMQTFTFAGILAFSYGTLDKDRYFRLVAGGLGAALIFLRFDAYLAIVPVAGAAALLWVVERRSAGWAAGLIVAGASLIAAKYYNGPMIAYFWQYRENLPSAVVLLIGIAGAIAITAGAGALRTWLSGPLKRTVPWLLILALLGLAVYALFLRQPGGLLTDYNAFALRRFRDAYLFWPALVAGMFGLVTVTRIRFWKEPAFFLLLAAFSTFLFYKIRVQPEHFWMARRFLPVILPGLLLLAAAGALGIYDQGNKRPAWRAFAATVLFAFIGWQYAVAAAPVAAHVEYRGAIRQLEKLAERVNDRDLVIFESRESGDVHILALPLAYTFGKNVLVLDKVQPDRRKMEEFLAWAEKKYERILFVANAGTDLLSSTIIARPIIFTPMALPEYATAGWDEYPAGARRKDAGYCLYQLSTGDRERRGFSLDVGDLDDLHVRSVFARETTEGRSIRWTRRVSFIAVTGLAGRERELTLVMNDGGRPATAPPARVEVFFNETSLGTVQLGRGFSEYAIAIPGPLTQAAAPNRDPAQLRLVSTTWTPRDYVGGTDDRALGVMIDRVEIH